MRENTEVDDLNNENESGGDNAPTDNDDISSESQPLDPLETLDPRLEELIYAQNNDVGNSYRFVLAVEDKVDEHLKFCIETQTWFYFNGNIWEEDKGTAKSIRLFIGAFQSFNASEFRRCGPPPLMGYEFLTCQIGSPGPQSESQWGSFKTRHRKGPQSQGGAA